MKGCNVPDTFLLLSSQSSNVENSSDEQEFSLQYLVARASHPGFHPLSAMSNRLLSKPLEQMSGSYHQRCGK